MNKKNSPTTTSKVAIALGIVLLALTPFWFQVGRSLDTSWIGAAGIFFGWCSVILWLLVCMVIITFGILKYSDTKK